MKAGGGDGFEKGGGERLGGADVHLPAERHDASERRHRVGGAGGPVRLFHRRPERGARGIQVLDHCGRRVPAPGGCRPVREIGHQADRGIEVQDVVVGEFLSVQLPRARDSRPARPRFPVERRRLVRVFPVAKFGHPLEVERDPLREGRLVTAGGEGGGNRSLVGGAGGKGSPGKTAAQFPPDGRVRVVESRQHRGVVGGVHHHRHLGPVLGGGPDQARAPDVNVLPHFALAGAPRHGLLERVEVHRDHIHRADSERRQRSEILRSGPPGEDAPVNSRMESLDPPVEDFGMARDFGNRDPPAPRRPRGSARCRRSPRSRSRAASVRGRIRRGPPSGSR